MFGSFGASNTTGGAFGNPQQGQQQAGASANTQGTPSLFGNPAQNTTGGGLFGSTQQGGASGTGGGGLFGNTNTGNSGGSLFGATQPQQQQPSGSGGLFGNTATQPAGGLFGTQSNTGGTAPGGPSLFGSTTANNPSTATGGGLFGNTGSNTNTTSGGGLFGNATGTGNTGGGGLFGNTGTGGGGGLFGNTAGQNTNAGGGPFGNPAGTSSNPGGGGLFGSTTNANTNTNTGGGLFGNAGGSATGGGLFGSTTNQPASAPSGGLFGSTNNQSAPSLFGQTQTQQPQQQPAGSSLFGQPAQQQQQQPRSLFGGLGQQQPGNAFGSTLGRSALPGSGGGNLFSSSVPGQQQADAQSQFLSLAQRIESITQAWMPNSPSCRFQYYFYNLVDPSQVNLYGRPLNANDTLWQKATRENPDPSCLVPVIATGFDDVQKRVEAQTQQAAAHQEKLKELQKRIADLAQRHQLSNASRLHRAAALQTQLTHRVLKVVQHLHLLIPALRSSAIRPEEEALRVALEDLDQEVRRPGGIGRIRGKLNELWALVGALNATRERDRKGAAVEWAVVDEEGLSHITQILAEEQAGLAHLTKILQRDLRDMAVIQGTPVRQDDGDTLMGSTATLRGSTY